MKHRLFALVFAAALVSAAPLALADVPNPTTSSSGSGGSTSSSTTSGTGGSESGDNGGGCASAPGSARGSAAALIALGLLAAVPLVRRRARA